ncbi:MAG TPA: hypothetical protein VGB45_05170 [Abditibacterium sp.]|jgi:uncharacterized membrane protein
MAEEHSIDAKLDRIFGQMQQMQVDMAELKATAKGDGQNVNQRLTSLEGWRDSFNKTAMGIFTGILITVGGGIFLLVLKGGLHLP